MTSVDTHREPLRNEKEECYEQTAEVRVAPHTDSWVAGVVDALQAPAVGVQAAPLVPSLLRLGAAAARRAETVAAVPGQHRSSLCHDSWMAKRRETQITQLI